MTWTAWVNHTTKRRWRTSNRLWRSLQTTLARPITTISKTLTGRAQGTTTALKPSRMRPRWPLHSNPKFQRPTKKRLPMSQTLLRVMIRRQHSRTPLSNLRNRRRQKLLLLRLNSQALLKMAVRRRLQLRSNSRTRRIHLLNSEFREWISTFTMHAQRQETALTAKIISHDK